MDNSDFPSLTRRSNYDIDIDEELKSLKKSKQSNIDADNMESILNSSRWDVSTVKLRVGDRERPRSRETDIDSRAMITCLKREIAEYKDQNAKLCELVRDQKKRLEKCSEESYGIDLIRERTSVTVSALQKEYRSSQERVVDLESRNRALIEEREKLEARVMKSEKRLFEFSTEVLRSIGLDDIVKEDGYEVVLEKLREWFRSHNIIRVKHENVTSEMKKMEGDLKEQRATVDRLMKEISSASSFKEKCDALQKELETQLLSRKDLENEINDLQERLQASKDEVDSLSKKLEERAAALSKLDVERRFEITRANNFEAQYNSLKQSLAAMLSDPYSNCAARDDDIKDRIRALQLGQKEKSQSYTNVEDRIRDLTKKFEQQYELHYVAEQKVRDAEREIQKLQEKLAHNQREIGAGDVFRDSLKEERQKCQRAIMKVAKALKVEKERLELDGIEVVADLIVRRVEMLVESRERSRGGGDLEEAPRHVDFELETESAASLKRRLAKAKEQLEAKETHLDLLRKKLAKLEERNQSGRLTEEDDKSVFSRLDKRLRRSEEQLTAAKIENANLRAELHECQNLRIQVLEQDEDIKAMERTMEKLEKVRQKQAMKIAHLKSSIEDTERAVEIEAPKDDRIRALKEALDEAKRHERALREFRHSICRLIGVSSKVKDSDVLVRVERVMRSALAESLSNRSSDAHEGSIDAAAAAHAQRHHRSRSPSPHERVRTSSLSRAQRSNSPIRVDSRQY